MKSFSFLLPMPFYVYIHLLLLFTLNSLLFGQNRIVALSFGNQTDHLALLKFKESISNDPYGVLDSWNSSTQFCNWHGITCSPKHQRVTKLYLQGYLLRGSLSPYVGNLSHIGYLNLGNNSFHGNIPQELGLLLHLQKLYLSNNSFAGEIPKNVTNCSNLRDLYMEGNNLIGKIPVEIGLLQKLQLVEFSENNLTGIIPPFIRNLSSLTGIWIRYNNLEGDIPQEMCHLKKLTSVVLSVNKLSGTFPSCLYNMSSLTNIASSSNQIHGSLPHEMFHTLPNLQYFTVNGNNISGPIPTSVANASTLTLFDIGQNHFLGQVPSLGKLHNLCWLNLYKNNLGDNSTKDLEFLKSLTNCTKLSRLSISYNKFGGSLLNSIGNLSTQLSTLYLGGNQISGKIPLELGNLINLILLTMENSHFEGTIPTTIGKFHKMQVLDFSGNKLSGEIPFSIGNLNQLYHLGIGKNMLEGNIPPSIANCQKLQTLYLSQNNFRGVIPVEVFSLQSLTTGLYLSQNSLTGSLSAEVGYLQNIEQIDVSENHLSGEIPRTIGDCISLEYLILKENSFHGTIPSTFASLKGLQELDLSRNQLSGSIPNGLENITFLEYFNVSNFNMLEGEVPTNGVFRNASALAVTGNNKLCGGVFELHLPPCHIKSKKHANHHNIKLIVVTISSIAILLTLLFILNLYSMRKRIKKTSSDSPIIDQLVRVSYQNLHNATDGFSTRNLIGSGNFSSVYKGTLELAGGVVAIKVLNLQKKGAHKSFIAECNALKNIRHRNLVKILTCCSGTDYKGGDFKAIIYEYMINGSLESWLHPQKETIDQPESLNLEQRLNIIFDVASAFRYLHYECEHPIIHCDLKPSNVLLNDLMVAKVSDFGLSRILLGVGVPLMQSNTVGIKGFVGYAPPEYGMGSELSIEGDMYSFGIFVLEVLTGRRPTDEMFKDGHNLHNYVKHSIPGNLLQIVDQNLLLNGIEHNIGNGSI